MSSAIFSVAVPDAVRMHASSPQTADSFQQTRPNKTCSQDWLWC